MKLLLTSAGFTNQTIIDGLLQLTLKEFNTLKLVFIPTAANIEPKDKGWLIDDLYNCKKLNFAEIEIVDISTPENNLWLPKLIKADILMFGGGNTFHLIYWIRKMNLEKMLDQWLKTKTYIGISAGSMVVCPTLALSQSKKLYYPNLSGRPDESGLGYVNFLIKPHYNSPSFPEVNEKELTQQAKEIKYPIFGIDDQSAVIVNDNDIKVVSEGNWKLFNTINTP